MGSWHEEGISILYKLNNKIWSPIQYKHKLVSHCVAYILYFNYNKRHLFSSVQFDPTSFPIIFIPNWCVNRLILLVRLWTKENMQKVLAILFIRVHKTTFLKGILPDHRLTMITSRVTDWQTIDFLQLSIFCFFKSCFYNKKK